MLLTQGGIDQYTRLMLHMLADFNDYTYANGPKTVTLVNSPTIDTSILNAWGTYGGCGKFVASSSQYLSLAASSDFNIGSSDYTFDLRVRYNSLPSSGNAYNPITGVKANGSDEAFNLYLVNISGVYYYVWAENQWATSLFWKAVTPSTGVWYHIAVTRQGSSNYLFQGGNEISSATDSTSIADAAGGMYIASYNAGSGWLDGWIDEFRFSKGIARWTSNFTPPTAPYDMSGNNLESGTGVDGLTRFQRTIVESGVGGGDA